MKDGISKGYFQKNNNNKKIQHIYFSTTEECSSLRIWLNTTNTAKNGTSVYSISTETSRGLRMYLSGKCTCWRCFGWCNLHLTKEDKLYCTTVQSVSHSRIPPLFSLVLCPGEAIRHKHVPHLRQSPPHCFWATTLPMPPTLPAQLLPLSGEEHIFNNDYALALLQQSAQYHSLHIASQRKASYIYHWECHLMKSLLFLNDTHWVAFENIILV